MEKIYLFCSAGMSTSMLATNMQVVANKCRLPIEILAFSINDMEEIIRSLHPDCILLGPQVKHMYDDTYIMFGGESGLPIGVIDANDYGMINGNKVLQFAIQLIKKNRIKMKERYMYE